MRREESIPQIAIRSAKREQRQDRAACLGGCRASWWNTLATRWAPLAPWDPISDSPTPAPNPMKPSSASSPIQILNFRGCLGPGFASCQSLSMLKRELFYFYFLFFKCHIQFYYKGVFFCILFWYKIYIVEFDSGGMYRNAKWQAYIHSLIRQYCAACASLDVHITAVNGIGIC